MSTLREREQAVAVNRVFNYMRQHKLSLADLTEYGGEDIPNPKLPEKICSPARVKKARAVERCWELIARLGLTFAALEFEPSREFSNHIRPKTRKSVTSSTWRGGYQKIINVFNDLSKFGGWRQVQ